MSKYRYEMGGIIRDTEIDFPYYTDEIIELLDEKDQRIAELEEQLKNSLENNNDLLKQIMDLQSQLIVERLKKE